MELAVSSKFEHEQQYWKKLDEILSTDCQTHGLIDGILRSYLDLVIHAQKQSVDEEVDLARCTYVLLSSALFEGHEDYVRRQILYSLLQDDDYGVLQVTATFLVIDGRINETTLELLNREGGFSRLVDLISSQDARDRPDLHRLLMDLLYEMSRVQRIKTEELIRIQDSSVRHLFEIIEEVSDDVNDPYHYPVIRVLLVLNEQFMVAAHDPGPPTDPAAPLINKVIHLLSSEGSIYKTFGENIILLLNRESETSLQLLTLKVLYLLFTTPLTYEYFYTNDLRVLVDILIRNLLDLPEEVVALRHTYLRVLYPLLAHTQLRHPPQYKREEIRKLLVVLLRGQMTETDTVSPTSPQWHHFEQVDETTLRLVNRCQKVTWLSDPGADFLPHVESPTTDSTSSTPTSPSKQGPPALPAPRKLTKRNSSKNSGPSVAPYFSPQLPSAQSSTLSVLEVAGHREKPGILTPSRKDGPLALMRTREKPPPPKSRRSGWSRAKENTGSETLHDSMDTQPVSAAGETSQEGREEDEVGVSLEAVAVEVILSQLSTESPVDIGSTLKAPSPYKKPPPAPKTRRWRGKRTKEEDEGGGGLLAGVRFRSISAPMTTMRRSTSPKPNSPVFYIPNPEKTLSGADVGSAKASISSALDMAHAEAIHSISETLEKASFPDPTDAASIPCVVLAPPSPVPPQSVAGSQVEVERSPFIGDDDDED